MTNMEDLLTELERARQEVANIDGDPTRFTLQASRLYEGVDILALRVLEVGVCHTWDVPADKMAEARKRRSFNFFIELAEAFAPKSVDRQVLARIASDYHHVRNSLKYRDEGTSAAKCYEYLEAILTIAYLIESPSELTFPVSLLKDLEGFKLLGIFVLKKRLLPDAWTVLHLSKPDVYGDEHVLSFFQHLNGQWLWKTRMDLGTWNVATVQLLESRSPTQEELLVWRRGGESMGLMAYDVLAVEDDEVLRLLQREGISGAYVIPKTTALEEHAGGRVTRFVWDGDGYVGARVIRPPVTKAGARTLSYSVLDGKVVGPNVIQLTVGESLELARQDFEGSIVRSLAGGNGVMEWKDGRLIATSVGEATLTLIPDVYDWDHALEVTVRVSTE